MCFPWWYGFSWHSTDTLISTSKLSVHVHSASSAGRQTGLVQTKTSQLITNTISELVLLACVVKMTEQTSLKIPQTATALYTKAEDTGCGSRDWLLELYMAEM